MNKKTIYLAFEKISYGNPGLIQKAIVLRTGGTVYHSELILPNEDGTYDMVTASSTQNKVRRKQHKFNTPRYIYIKIEITAEQLDTIEIFINKILGSGYDFFGILGFISPFKDRSDLWFCSEVGSNALKIIGIPFMMTKEPSKTSPAKLLMYLIDNGYKICYPN